MSSRGCEELCDIISQGKHRTAFLSVTGSSGSKHAFVLPKLRGTLQKSYLKVKGSLKMLSYLRERAGKNDLIREVSNLCNIPKPCLITPAQG